MERKTFIKSACALGLCSCAGMSLITNTSAFANTEDDQKEARTMGFIHKRFATLINNMDSNVDKETLKKILEELGRTCAKENSKLFEGYKNNIEGFLEEIKKQWIEKAEYDKEQGTIRITGKKTGACYCPLADKSITPKEFCNCTIGWNKEIYETVSGKSVNVQIEESVLRGGERCSFLISLS